MHIHTKFWIILGILGPQVKIPNSPGWVVGPGWRLKKQGQYGPHLARVG